MVDAQTKEAAAKKEVVEGEEAIASEKAAAAKAIKVSATLTSADIMACCPTAGLAAHSYPLCLVVDILFALLYLIFPKLLMC